MNEICVNPQTVVSTLVIDQIAVGVEILSVL